jgi:hypothetical protein
VSVGRSSARNSLSLKATGSLIAIMDADDVCLPWRFTLTRRLMKKYDAVFAAAFLFGHLPFGIPVAISHPITIRPEIAPMILSYRNPFIHSTAIFRREAVTPGHLYEEVVAEEYLLWVKMANKGCRFYRSRFPVVGYRLHPKQVSGSQAFASEVESCVVLSDERKLLASRLIAKEKLEILTGASNQESIQIHVRKTSHSLYFEENIVEFLSSKLPFLRRKLDTWKKNRT